MKPQKTSFHELTATATKLENIAPLLTNEVLQAAHIKHCGNYPLEQRRWFR